MNECNNSQNECNEENTIVNNLEGEWCKESEESEEGGECEHQYIIDLIDIDPDRAQLIEYCLKCFDVKQD
jgi:hypothetical protein